MRLEAHAFAGGCFVARRFACAPVGIAVGIEVETEPATVEAAEHAVFFAFLAQNFPLPRILETLLQQVLGEQ